MRILPRGWAVAAALLLAVAGCSVPTDAYLAQRGRDLADCVEATIGVGAPAYVRVKWTDTVVVGAGLARAQRWGWPGPRGAVRSMPGGEETAMGVPFLYNYELIEKWTGGEGETIEVTTRLPLFTDWRFTTRKHVRSESGGDAAEDKDEPERGVSAASWVGLKASCLLSVSVGLNLREAWDFLLGCLGWDLLDDDAWPPADRREA